LQIFTEGVLVEIVEKYAINFGSLQLGHPLIQHILDFTLIGQSPT